jgi:hypothetical protein
MPLVCLSNGQSERKSAALSERAFDPDAPAVRFNGQPDPDIQKAKLESASNDSQTSERSSSASFPFDEENLPRF